ncbi:MAG: lipopolysaccharide heptosyltransferase II [Anaerolineae bacterium]|nr:lipopolysaccharide heptosyltransferase II [Anaerolineae bacterium]
MPFSFFARKPFTLPEKAIILQPCCLSQIMLTTPLLAALSNAFPETRFDWLVSDWARPAIAGNPRLTELVDSGSVNIKSGGYTLLRELAQKLREEAYDTCIVPSRSGVMALLPWRAGIPQRIGLNVNGRGFAHTIAVKPAKAVRHASEVYLTIAEAVGINLTEGKPVGMEFYPPDLDRTRITRRLVEDLDWLGDQPLMVLHPGGASNPLETNLQKQWPSERFVRLGNYLARKYNARIVLVGSKADKSLVTAVSGMMSNAAVDLAGQLSLGELGALCEVADLYVGNDTGPTHVAAAVGCPTLAIFGPSNPAFSKPYGTKGKVIALWKEWDGKRPFTWDNGIMVEEAIEAAKTLIK